jgi:outer membrane protein assembly factor BamB
LTRKNFSKYTRLIGLLALTMVLTTACTQRIGVSWANMSIVTSAEDILVAYESDLALVSRSNGFLVTQDLQGTTNVRDASGVWKLNGRDVGAQFYTAPLFVEYGEDRLMLVADYNNRLFTVNFTQACFANRVGACVGQEPPFIELPDHSLANMTQDDQRIYVPLDNGVMALNKGLYEAGWDVDSPEERRRRFDETLTVAWTLETEREVWATPIIFDGYVYVTSMDHHLYKVDAETGETVAKLKLSGAIASSAIIYDGETTLTADHPFGEPITINTEDAYIYVGTFGHKVYKIPLNFQSEAEESSLISFKTKNWVWGAPSLIDGVLYVADLGGNVYALDVMGTEISQIWHTSANSGGIRAAPLVTENHVIVASREGKVHWLSREDGSIFTEQDVRNEVLSDLLLVEGDENREALVVVSTVNTSRIMVAFTLEGAPRWTYPSS